MTINCINNKRILVTGACGTVGSKLIDHLANEKNYRPLEIIGIDNNEGELFLHDQKYLHKPKINFEYLDIRDSKNLRKRFEGVNIVFHCAALKHVITSEISPEQFILTNINGLQNVIEAASDNNVEKLIFTSSDKAVNPTNVMGASKLMGEKIITAANKKSSSKNRTIFASTRFGNVLGSRGSVVPIFYNQIMNEKPITITHKDMTRFVMSIDRAADLILNSAHLSCGGEVFITKMPVLKIEDLARAMLREMLPSASNDEIIKYPIQYIGIKPGEKLYEELMTSEEVPRTFDLGNYFIIKPAYMDIYRNMNYTYGNMKLSKVTKQYISDGEEFLKIDEIRELMRSNNLFDLPQDGMQNRYWPGDKLNHTI